MNMKRRTFIKTAAATCAAPAFLMKATTAESDPTVELTQRLHLTTLGDEVDESPCLVGDRRTKAWLLKTGFLWPLAILWRLDLGIEAIQTLRKQDEEGYVL